jgi:hypothetical protein
MGGASKKRAQAEKKTSGSSGSQPSSGHGYGDTQRSTPKAIPRLDGNRDPGVYGGASGSKAIDYTDPRDLKNISEFLGMAGWSVARGVSLACPLGPVLAYYIPLSMRLWLIRSRMRDNRPGITAFCFLSPPKPM